MILKEVHEAQVGSKQAKIDNAEAGIELLKLKKRFLEFEKKLDAIAKAPVKQWLSLAEVKEEYGYEVGTVYQLNNKRKITTRKAGGLQVKRSSLEKYLKGKTKLSAIELTEV